MISTAGSGERNLFVSYISEVPIWKSTYRLVLPPKGKPLLQGWAVVDNTVGEDWNNVELSLVLSHDLWARRFNSDPDILGKQIRLNDRLFRAIGVMPRGFRMYLGPGTSLPERIDLFFLGSLTDDGLGTSRSDHSLTTVARLRPGVTFRRAQSEIDVIAAAQARQYPKVYGNSSVKFHLVPLHKDVVERVRPAVMALLGAVGFVLLIGVIGRTLGTYAALVLTIAALLSLAISTIIYRRRHPLAPFLGEGWMSDPRIGGDGDGDGNACGGGGGDC